MGGLRGGHSGCHHARRQARHEPHHPILRRQFHRALRPRQGAFVLDIEVGPLEGFRQRRGHREQRPRARHDPEAPLHQRIQELRLKPPHRRPQEPLHELEADLHFGRRHLRAVLQLELIGEVNAPDALAQICQHELRDVELHVRVQEGEHVPQRAPVRIDVIAPGRLQVQFAHHRIIGFQRRRDHRQRGGFQDQLLRPVKRFDIRQGRMRRPAAIDLATRLGPARTEKGELFEAAFFNLVARLDDEVAGRPGHVASSPLAVGAIVLIRHHRLADREPLIRFGLRRVEDLVADHGRAPLAKDGARGERQITEHRINAAFGILGDVIRSGGLRGKTETPKSPRRGGRFLLHEQAPHRRRPHEIQVHLMRGGVPVRLPERRVHAAAIVFEPVFDFREGIQFLLPQSQ